MNDPTIVDAMKGYEMVAGRIPDHIKNEFLNNGWRTHDHLTKMLIDRADPIVTRTVYGLLEKTYVSPYTSFIFPLRQLSNRESIFWRWNQIEYSQDTADEVETEGLARYMTSTVTARGERLIRRGKAIKIESQFYENEEGRKKWTEQISQLTTTLVRTNEIDVMLTLLASPCLDPTKGGAGVPNQIYGLQPRMNPEERFNMQMNCFGMINKFENMPFHRLVTFLQAKMRARGVEPDTIIVPSSMMLFYYSSNPQLTEYSSAGSEALKNREIAFDSSQGMDNGVRTNLFNGLKVVDTHVHRQVAGGSRNVSDLLTVPKQIGEFYPMMTKESVPDMRNGYSGKSRDIHIFDEKQNKMMRVTYLDAIDNCMRWDPDGNLDQAEHGNDRVRSDMFKAADGSVHEYWHQLSREWLSEESINKVILSVVRKMDVMGNFAAIKEHAHRLVHSYSRRINELKIFDDDPKLKVLAESLSDLFKYNNNNRNLASLRTRIFDTARSNPTLFPDAPAAEDNSYTDSYLVKVYAKIVRARNTSYAALYDALVDYLLAFTPVKNQAARLDRDSLYTAFCGSAQEIGAPVYAPQNPGAAGAQAGAAGVNGVAPAPGLVPPAPANQQALMEEIVRKINAIFHSNQVDNCCTTDLCRQSEDYVRKLATPIEKMIAYVWLHTRIHRDNLRTHHLNDIYVPVDFILARPYMTYQTSTVIMLKSGRETGEMVVGQAKFELTNSGLDRMLYGSYFYYGKAVLYNPINVVVAPSVFIQDYMYGNNTKFITRKDLDIIRENGGISHQQDRSILAIMTKVNDDINSSNIIDIRGYNRELRHDMNRSKPYYSTAQYYNSLYDIADEKLASAWELQDYETENYLMNSICALGHVEDSERRQISACCGHLGNKTYDGVGLTRKPGFYGSLNTVH